MKRWETIYKYQISFGDRRIKYQIDTEKVLKILLNNRGVKTKKEVEEFLNPKLESVASEGVGIDKREIRKAIGRIQKAITNKEQIVVFGDYDVDGICGSAILWETLNDLGAKVLPYIPHRVEEGYGLSVKGISNIKYHSAIAESNIKLIITVDNGIVANEAVDFANKQGIDVIITDHHVPAKRLPEAYAIVHTTKLCGAGVAYLLAQEIIESCHPERSERSLANASSNRLRDSSSVSRRTQNDIEGTQNNNLKNNHLELVALATIADLVPLLGANRTLVKFGLEALRRTKRIGLLELFKEAGLDKSTIGIYEVGHIIAPRLNAMGRLEYAMDSLRLLCTKNRERAKILAEVLGNTNRERQELTLETVLHAKDNLKSQISNLKSTSVNLKSLLFIAHESYQQGVIGLVAGKLVEEFYRPSIVVSIGEKYSKASARSVNGFNIIEFIRSASELLVDAGGHPMAAGFTVETSKLSILKKMFEDKAEELLTEEKLTRSLRIDCELDLSLVNNSLYQEIQKLAPFGMGNPEPTFVSRKVEIRDIRVVGNERKHLKLRVTQPNSQLSTFNFQLLDGIAFGMGDGSSEFKIGDAVDIAYTIDENAWNGNKKLQLKIKDIK